MNNPYQSPIAQQTPPPRVVTNPTYQIEQLVKRFNRLRWCAVACYAPLALLVTACAYSLRIGLFGVGPIEMAMFLLAPAIVLLIVTRKK